MVPPDRMGQWVTDLRGTLLLPGAGHWVQQERPDEVNAALLGFLDEVPI
jgi:pimeloyl-ACP methyl ester carboxylesterase